MSNTRPLSEQQAGSTPQRGEAIALHGDILHLRADPGWAEEPATDSVCFEADGWLLFREGRVESVQRSDFAPPADYRRVDHRGQLVLPGFIDTHVHAPQLDVIASYGTELLQWLDTYTFPAEKRFVDPEAAREGAERFLDALIAHGTTSAVVFPTVHRVSVEALFEASRQRGMRIIAGKVLMDRHCPDGLRDTSIEQTERDSVELIERWHGKGRLSYAITVRFAPTSSEAQLELSGALMKRYAGADGGLYMQTHVAENRAEVEWVRELFPTARSYLDVYAKYGLLSDRAVLAHGIWLDDEDRNELARARAQIAFCPSSNLFLGSGLFPWRRCFDAGVPVSMASDVGAGTSLNGWRTMADGYKVLALQGERQTAWRALHATTLGAAEALGLESEIGGFIPGATADVCVWSWAEGGVQRHRQTLARSLHEKLFALMTMGDERNLRAVYVQGRAMENARRPSSAAGPSSDAHPRSDARPRSGPRSDPAKDQDRPVS